MTRHYSTRDFFRNMPNALLARYFAARGVLQDFDFTAIKETKIDGLFEAWMELPEVERVGMEAEMREIWDMSCPTGYQSILDEAAFHLNDADELVAFKETLMGLPGHHERAMTTFLDYAVMWKGATRFYHADNLSYWRKRKNMPKVAAATDPASLIALETAICRYYKTTEGRGMHCKVEPYRRGDYDYFFAFPEDYAQRSSEWEGEDITVRSHHPAFEIVFVYRQAEGTLDLNVTGDKKAVEPLQAIFTEHILNCAELPTDPDDKRVYHLGALRQRTFNFVWSVGNGIESVAVNRLRLSLYKPKNAKFIIEADPKHNPKVVYDLLDKLAPVLPSHEYFITQVGVTALVKAHPTERAKTVNFNISYPNSCSLKYDEVGVKLRTMLEASGIEPREPDALVEAVALADA